MAKAEASGVTLSYKDTQIVMGMLKRGDRQHDIAAYFGVNGGRIGEIARYSIPVFGDHAAILHTYGDLDHLDPALDFSRFRDRRRGVNPPGPRP